MITVVQLPNWSDKTILIAEDLDDNYAILAALLKRTNVHLLRAHNGAEAVDLVSRQPNIDIVLMDISMPDMNGIEALRLIRQQMPGKIVIAQTAHEISEIIAAEEFDDFLQKPIRRKGLIELLSKYLQ